MQNIVVPVSELVAYLDDTLYMWPRGYNVEPSGPARNEVLMEAAVAFAESYIRSTMRHVRRRPDPVVDLITALGYPVRAMSEDDLDALCVDADDLLMNMQIMFDPMVDHVHRVIGNRSVEFRHVKFTEDLIIEVKSDRVVERYKELLKQVKRMTPPTIVRELDDLDQVAEYIDYAVDEVFKNIHDPTIRDEVKRMYLERVSRE